MIIKEIELNNFRIYKGVNTIDLDLLVKTGAETPQKQENATL